MCVFFFIFFCSRVLPIRSNYNEHNVYSLGDTGTKASTRWIHSTTRIHGIGKEWQNWVEQRVQERRARVTQLACVDPRTQLCTGLSIPSRGRATRAPCMHTGTTKYDHGRSPPHHLDTDCRVCGDDWPSCARDIIVLERFNKFYLPSSFFPSLQVFSSDVFFLFIFFSSLLCCPDKSSGTGLCCTEGCANLIDFIASVIYFLLRLIR